MVRGIGVLLAGATALHSPGVISAAAAAAAASPAATYDDADASHGGPKLILEEGSPRGLESRTWDEASGRYVAQRLLVEPGAAENELVVSYERGGDRVVDGRLEVTDTKAIWTADVAGNLLEIEASVDGLGVNGDELTVRVNGTDMPDFAAWWRGIWSGMQGVSATDLEHAFLTEPWATAASERLQNPELFLVTSKEMAQLTTRYRARLAEQGIRTQGVPWSCVFCTVAILTYLAETGLALAGALPTGGASLAVFLIAHYGTLAGTVATCITCGRAIKKTTESAEAEEAEETTAEWTYAP